jgi:sec-independent protein translocase protein TatA
MFGLPNGAEWIIILIIVLLLFGGKKVPELMRGVGKGVGELQKGLAEGKRAIETAYQEEVRKPIEADTKEEPPTPSGQSNG